jgi:hypothetical protein
MPENEYTFFLITYINVHGYIYTSINLAQFPAHWL